MGCLILTVSGCKLDFTVKKESQAESTASVASPSSPSYIVVFKPEAGGTGESLLGELSSRYRALGALPGRAFRSALKGASMALPARALESIRRDSRVMFVSPDLPVQANAQVIPTGVNRSEADQSAVAAIRGDGGDVDVDIAIIDTGVESFHPDLNVFRSEAFGGLQIPRVDGNGHGTHVGGIAAARDNTSHVVGVAPGARLWSLKVLSALGSGMTSGIIEAIDYVTEHAAEIEVVNMSLGGSGQSDNDCGRQNSDAFHLAICNSVAKGVVYVVAAGNEAKDAALTVPAAYPEVITVSAIADTDGREGGLGPDSSSGPDDSLASFSNYGPVVDIAAPGVNILSTYRGGQTRVLSGTSMASPHVAGAIALYLSRFGKPTDAAGVARVRDEIKQLAFPQSSSQGFDGDRDSSPEPLLNAAIQ